MLSKADEATTAAMIRWLIDAVHRGELDASSPAGTAMLRRLEGAAAAFAVVAE